MAIQKLSLKRPFVIFAGLALVAVATIIGFKSGLEQVSLAADPVKDQNKEASGREADINGAALKDKFPDDRAVQAGMIPHKALYAIKMVKTRGSSKVLNISGEMYYEWKPACEGWIVDHRFNLFYEYADAPGLKITSDFSTFESYDGDKFTFSARRKREGALYEEFRGKVNRHSDGDLLADYSIPETADMKLPPDTIFPMRHTLELLEKARKDEKIYHATVFDGSDDEGPEDINAVIGSEVNAVAAIDPSADIDMSLINVPSWRMRLAFFPTFEKESESDYEMSATFSETGVISDMTIEYDDFTVAQQLKALEVIDAPGCIASENEDSQGN